MSRFTAALTRREFLKASLANAVAWIFPGRWLASQDSAEDWPSLHLTALPEFYQRILGRVSPCGVGKDGYLRLLNTWGYPSGRVPQVRTQWNIENSTPLDRLLADIPWAVVLHWFDEPDSFEDNIVAYLRGFDGLRQVRDYQARTSAHFLVGNSPPFPEGDGRVDIGVFQTQMPDADGTPFLASHLRFLDYRVNHDGRQFFIRALDQLQQTEPGVQSLLQEFFNGPKIDPGWRTIAVEITGHDFDTPQYFPGEQKLANVLSVVWALMRRYRICANDIIGHQEIDVEKTDPGRGFMAWIRLLLGLKALVDRDPEMMHLVFGRFNHQQVPEQAVKNYFKFLHDYLVLVSRPSQLFAWEVSTKYWFINGMVRKEPIDRDLASRFDWPLQASFAVKGDTFLKPTNHEGVDLYPLETSPAATPVFLVANGVCLHTEKSYGYCPGWSAIFRHRLPEGGEILTFYGHLSTLGEVQVGSFYRQGSLVGWLESPLPYVYKFLHFAVAYGTVWEIDLSHIGYVPLEANPYWISDRFLPPLEFLHQRMEIRGSQMKESIPLMR